MKRHFAADAVLLWIGALGSIAAVVTTFLWAPGFELNPSPPFTWARVLAADFSAPGAFSQLNIPLRSIAVFLLWLLGIWGVGDLLCMKLLPRISLFEERALFGFATGFVVLGLITAIVGFLAANAISSWLILVIAGLAGLARTESLYRTVKATLAPLFGATRIEAIVRHALLGFFLIALFAGFLYAMVPPTQSDAMRYHLAAPQEYLKAGKIVYLAGNAFSNFPFLPEMHFMLALGAGAPESSQMMHFTCMLLVALALLAFCRRFVEPVVEGELEQGGLIAVVAPLMYLAAPMSFILGSWPFIDHAVTLLLVCALFGLLLAFETGAVGMYAIAGMMLGGAIGSKYTIVPFAIVFAVIIAVEWVAFSPPIASRRPRSVSIPKVLLWATLVVLASAVWFAKNWAFTGNPVYPLANSVFGGGEWSVENARFYASRMADKGVPKTLTHLLRPLVESTYNWHRYEQHFPGAMLLLALVAGVPGIVIATAEGRTRSRFMWYSVAAGCAWYVLWFFTYQSNRMLLPLIAFLAPAVAAFAAQCRTGSRFAHVLFTLAAAVALIHGALWALKFEFTGASPPPIRYLTGAESREKYMTRALSYWYPFQYLNERVSPGQRVLLIGEHRIYGAQFQAIWSDWFDTPAFLRLLRENRIDSPEACVTMLRRNGVRYVLYNETELRLQDQLWRSRFSDSEWNLLEDFLESDELKRTDIPPGVAIFEVSR